MKYITDEIIDDAVDYINSLSEDTVVDFIDYFKEHQPYLMVYLAGIDGDLLDEGERETLVFLGAAIWYSTEVAKAKVPLVGETILDNVENNNIKMIEYFEKEDEDGFARSIETMINNHPQKALIGFAVTSVMEDEAIRDENKGMVFIHLKTFIECLDAAHNAVSEG